MTRPPLRLLVLVLLFPAGYGISQVRSYEPLYRGEFAIAQEQTTTGDIQFFALQRIGAKQIDMATLSIDGELPLAGALRMAALRQQRIRITVEVVEPRTLEELKR